MNYRKLILPVAALGTAAAMLVPVEQTEGYSLLGFTLPTTQRDFRIWNNFTDTQANNNQTPNPNFPGYQGAVMAIWKGSVEWGSTAHGNGGGDPTQSTLGNGGANYDPTFQGLATSAGGINDNIHSELSGGSGGVLAFTESPDAFGWRIRYYSTWVWDDGPGGIGFNNFDLQGVACHEMGHAIGLGHTQTNGATMYPSIGSGDTTQRSIQQDDINGVRAAYGTANNGKCRIDSICIASGQIVVTGANFSATNNEMWFTQAGQGGTGNPIKVTGLASDGTTITATIPGNAGPGDVLVRNNGGSGANLSNAWPTDLQDTGGNCGGGVCPDPVNYCISSPNSTGSGMVMGHHGSTCASDQNFTLTASGGPANTNGIFYYGPNQTLNSFGDGFRCVGGTTFRLPIVQTDFFGDVEYTLDWTVPPVGSGNGAWEAGDTWNCQYWYRDPAAGGAGFNLSDGLEVTLGP